MRVLIIISLTSLKVVFCISIFSQNFEVFGGINKNVFYDNIHNDPFYGSTYKSDYGYYFGLSIDNKKVNQTLYLRFTLKFDQYRGYLNCNDVALGGGTDTKGTIKKSVLSFGFYPLNIHVFHKIDLNIGIDVSTLLFEHVDGTKSAWLYKQYNWTHDLQDEYDQFSRKFSAGPIGRIAYGINLSKSLILTPQYIFYYGLLKEFQHFPEETKSYRHYFCLGIKKTFK